MNPTSFPRRAVCPWPVRRVAVVAGLLGLLLLVLTLSSAGAQDGQEVGSDLSQGSAVIAPSQETPPPLPGTAGKPVLHPLGIGLALLFVFLMVNLFRWMFKVPPQVPYAVVKARQSVSALQRILVPTSQEAATERAVELACRLGQLQKAEIVLTYIMEVPFTLSLNAAMPAEEARGQEALRTAQFIVEQHGLPVKSVLIPHRYAWNGILRVAREEGVDAIVMSVGGGRPGQAEAIGSTAQEVLKRAECEVILDKRPAWLTPART